MLTRSPRYAHTDPIFKEIETLELNTILKFQMCKLIHRDLYGNNFFDLIPRSLVHSYSTRFNANISSTHVRTNLAAKFVLHKGIKFLY